MKKLFLVLVIFSAAYTAFSQTAAPPSDAILYWKGNGTTAGSGNTSLSQLGTALMTYGGLGTGSGTVTSASVVSANGLAGTVATATTTPAFTFTTTVNGIAKGNGTGFSAATAGTDYSAGTSALTTGIVKSTTTTGALTIAVAGDFPTLNQNTSGTAANVTGTVAVPNGGTGATTLTGLVKGNGTSAFTAATAGTDYVIPAGNITGTSANVTGTVAIANGGTGATSAGAALTALGGATDASVVHLAGTESVTGAKTFSTTTTLTGLNQAYLSVTGATTLTATNTVVVADMSSAAYTITLPSGAATANGRVYSIRTKAMTGTNYLTIATGGTDHIENGTNTTWSVKGNIGNILVYDGTAGIWYFTNN